MEDKNVFQKLGEGAKGVGNAAKKVKSTIKFFGSAIGQIIFYLILALLLGILIYIIVMVIGKSIAKLLKVEGGTQTYNEDAAYLKNLTNSGYDAMLNAKELAEYQAFEYAVLMDAARFMEETGTIQFEVNDISPINIEKDVTNRHKWAFLAARALAPDGTDDNKTTNGTGQNPVAVKDGTTQSTIKAGTAINDMAQDPSLFPGKQLGQQSTAVAQVAIQNLFKNGVINLNAAEFMPDHPQEDLFYEKVYNEYTKETSLVPYLNLIRNYDIVKYFMEYRFGESDKYLGYGSQAEVDALGATFNFGNMPFVQVSRFNGGGNYENWIGIEESAAYIEAHIFPIEIVQELNAGNPLAQKKVKGGEVDLYKTYTPSLYYTTSSNPSQHHIPLKILLERFLPNAALMASWRMLRSDTGIAGDDVVAEIQKIYSEACLSNETASGDKLLVKDVYTTSMNINKDTNAIDLFSNDVPLLQDKSKEKYLDGKKTAILYGSYEALFDSRIWGPPTHTVTPTPQNPTTPPSTSQTPGTQAPAPQPITQTFEGGFSGDVIDDIKLVLTHYKENNKVNFSSEIYEQILKDIEKVIAPNEDEPISLKATTKKAEDGQYIIYRPVTAGKYFVNCKATGNDAEFRRHYNITNSQTNVDNKADIMKTHDHLNNKDPYSATEEIKECFVPFLKIAFTHENGIRKTSVIVCYDDKYTGYVVKGKELLDYSIMTNQNTFAYFQTRDMKSTTVRHWKMANTKPGGGNSEEKWLVEDAFEGMALNIDGDNAGITVNYKYTQNGEEQQSLPIHVNVDLDTDDSVLYENIVIRHRAYNQNHITFNLQEIIKNGALLSAGSMAIVRVPDASKDPRDYTDLLDLPTDASISDEFAALVYGGSSKYTGGETILTDKTYIDLKKLGFKEGDDVDVIADFSKVIRDAWSSKAKSIVLLKLYCDAHPNSGIDFNIKLLNNKSLMENVYEWANNENIVVSAASVNVSSAPTISKEFAVVFPVTRKEVSITQEFWDQALRFYLVAGAETWSNITTFKNILSICGEYQDRSNPFYLINSNPFCKGISDYQCYKVADWRGNMYAPVFAGKADEAETKAREVDVLLVLSQWSEASEQGVRAADYYIRDLNALIKYSKGIDLAKEYAGQTVSPTIQAVIDTSPIIPPICYPGTEKPYINPGSYTYMYIPDEILLFDETSAEKAFWMDRLVTSDHDKIDESKENFLRSQMPTFTWQIVDYELYEECQNKDGTTSVYPLWMFGSQLSRTLYAMAANSSPKENYKVMYGWGGYASGFHRAADLYGRNQASKIYAEAFDVNGNAKIKSYYANGHTTLQDPSSLQSVANQIVFFSGDSDQYATQNINVDSGGTGLYFEDVPVTLKLEGNKYTFNGTAAAVYGYELYRQTKILRDADKAEQLLKEQLEKEIKWTEIYAVAPGIVANVKADARGGFAVTIAHSGNRSSMYLHMKRWPLVQIGQYVGAGTLLGYEGTTGNSGTYHVHFQMDGDNPVQYLYPFFTPFYYEEKAAEANYALDSEYMSTERTVFPYGQIPGGGLTLPANTTAPGDLEPGPNSASAEQDGEIVKIKNYVPYKPFVANVKDLYKDGESEHYIDYSKLPTKVKGNLIHNDLGGTNYQGDKLETNPCYFDKDFITAVMSNNKKISGVTLQAAKANP